MTALEHVEDALHSGRAIFHTTGDHAGESPEIFIRRKQADITELGYTYWYARSAQPPNARQFCKAALPTFVLFYERKPEYRRKRNGRYQHAGEPTNDKSARFGHMTHFCEGDRGCDRFVRLPDPLLQPGRCVTGLVDAGACGFKFDYLQEVQPEVPFNPSAWRSVFRKSSQAGVWCATMCEPSEQKEWYVVAVARMCKPYGVWFHGELGQPPAQYSS